MRNVKKIVYLMIALACLISLASCSSDLSDSTTPEDSTDISAPEPSTDIPVPKPSTDISATSSSSINEGIEVNETKATSDSSELSSSSTQTSAFRDEAEKNTSADVSALPDSIPNSNTERETEMIVNILVGNKSFTATLFNNDSTQALIAEMPLTLSMSELNGNEKYYYLSSSLPTDSQRVENIHTGDLMLYGSDCLVLFYEDFQTSYSYTRLGYIQNVSGLVDALGSGSVQVTFSVAN